jgi:hemin uptake protein HemP
MKQCMRTIDEYSENYYRLFVIKPPTPAQPLPAPAKVPSQALLGTRRELVITHNGREYRLRITQNGKLILTA